MTTSSRTDRGVAPVVAVVLLVAITVVLGATVAVFAADLSGRQTAPPRAVVTVEPVKLTPDEIDIEDEDDPGGCDNDYDGEIGFVVELTALDRADRISVVVHGETGERRKVVWEQPTQADVGTRRLLANEVTTGPVDVDIGKDGSDDFATCPDESVTLDFFAEIDGERFLLRQYQFN